MTEVGGRSSPPRGLVVAAFLLHLLPFVTRPALIGGDEPHYALAAYSLATDLDLDLEDDYDEVSKGSHAAGRKLAGRDLARHWVDVNGRRVFAHPIGLPVLAAPLIAALKAIDSDVPPDLLLGMLSLTVTFAALIAGWRLLRDAAGNGSAASGLVFGVYFASPLWYYSRTFFTEPFTWAFAVLAVSALARRRLVLAALFLALTLAMKETALLLVLPILLGSLALQGAATALTAAMGPALFGLLFMGKNWLLTGQPLSTFQPFEVGDFRVGSSGLLFDPAHGLIWFAPLLGVATLGWFLVPLNRQGWLVACSLGAFVGYFAVSAAWVDWRGGTSYGTRLLLPVLPVLALPLLRLSRALPPQVSFFGLGSLAALGFAVNFCAAVDPVPALWGPSAVELVASKPLVFLCVAALAAVTLWRLHRAGFASAIRGPADHKVEVGV